MKHFPLFLHLDRPHLLSWPSFFKKAFNSALCLLICAAILSQPSGIAFATATHWSMESGAFSSPFSSSSQTFTVGNKEAGRAGGLSRTDQQPSSTFEWRAGGRAGRPAGPTTCKLISRQRGEDGNGREEKEGRKGKEEKEGGERG